MRGNVTRIISGEARAISRVGEERERLPSTVPPIFEKRQSPIREGKADSLLPPNGKDVSSPFWGDKERERSRKWKGTPCAEKADFLQGKLLRREGEDISLAGNDNTFTQIRVFSSE